MGGSIGIALALDAQRPFTQGYAIDRRTVVTPKRIERPVHGFRYLFVAIRVNYENLVGQ